MKNKRIVALITGITEQDKTVWKKLMHRIKRGL